MPIRSRMGRSIGAESYPTRAIPHIGASFSSCRVWSTMQQIVDLIGKLSVARRLRYTCAGAIIPMALLPFRFFRHTGGEATLDFVAGVGAVVE
jgi:hypothetical protein